MKRMNFPGRKDFRRRTALVRTNIALLRAQSDLKRYNAISDTLLKEQWPEDYATYMEARIAQHEATIAATKAKLQP